MLSVLAVIVAISFVSMAALYIATEAILTEQIAQVESKATEQAAHTLCNNLNLQLEKITSTADDWASWDDTYNFIENNNTEYITSNLMDATFTNLNINIMLYVNPSHEAVFSKVVYSNQTSQQINQQTIDEFLSNYDLFFEDYNQTRSGIVKIQGVPLLITAHPILNSFHEGPVHGVLIMGRYIDERLIDEISGTIGLPLKIYTVDSPELPGYVEFAASKLSIEVPIMNRPLNESYTAGFTLLTDINDKPVLVAELDYYRSAYVQENTISIYTSVSFAIVGIVFFGITLMLLDKTVISRLTRINNSIKMSTETNLQPVHVEGNDEISNLAGSINNMLKTIDKSQKALNQQTQTLEFNVQKRTKELSEHQEKIKGILGASPDAILATDLQGNIIEANQKMVELSGVGAKREDLIGAPAAVFVPPQFYQELVQRIKDVSVQKDKVVRLECTLLRTDGSEYPAELSIGIIGDSEGAPSGIVAIIRDITDKKEIQERLFNSERLATIGQTAGMVGHDIRNPLQAIMGDLYLLKLELNQLPQEQGVNQKIGESIESMEDNVVYINKIVSDLQDYTRSLKPKIEVIALRFFVNKILGEIKIPKEIQTNTIVDEHLFINTDPYFLRRILTNLVINAVQAMPKDGRLTVHAYSADGKVVIKVQDTGAGIAKEAVPNLFKPLFTTKSKGQGLGLAVAKRFVEALDGVITFESEEGKGTTFTIYLPS